MPTAGGQTYVERPAVAALAGLVSSVWIQRVGPGAEPYRQRNLPSGAVELHCRLGDVPRVAGPLTGAVVEELAPGTTIIGLRFHPGAAAPVLGVPGSELVDASVGAEELWGADAVAVAERAHAAGSPEQALATVQQHVVGRLGGAAGPDRLVGEMVRQLRWRTEDVALLTRTLFISERQLRRRSQAAVGLAPKTLHRILRFQSFLALAQHANARGRALTDEGLARLAAEAGYADQAHLSRECVRLTGVPPSVLLGEAEEHCSCGHDHSASFAPVLRSRHT